MNKKLQYEQAMINDLISASSVIDNLKTIGAGNSTKINAFINHYARDFDPIQIEIIAMLFDFTDDQKAQAIAQFEKTIEG